MTANDVVKIGPLPPSGAGSRTRASSGERRSAVLARAASGETPDGLVERFQQFERDHEALDADLRLPEAYRIQQQAELWDALHRDVDGLEVDTIAARNRELTEQIEALTRELRQSNPGDLVNVSAYVDRAADVATLADLVDEERAIANPARLRRVLPLVKQRAAALGRDLRHAEAAHALQARVDAWLREHPSPVVRLRELEEERDATLNTIGSRFAKTKSRLGMRI